MKVTPTRVVFCEGVTTQTSIIQLVQHQSDICSIVTASTPFHPVSHIWPDHPADHGTLTINGQLFDVVDCQVGAMELATETLFVGQAIPVKRDAPGWAFVVVHNIRTEDYSVENGLEVELSVDAEYQRSLSRGHSAGHLASIALNKVLADGYWRKAPGRLDPIGNHDFNSYAQVSSQVSPDKCLDRYRLGKTLRKRGLNSGDLLEHLSEINHKLNQQLNCWLALKSPVIMRCQGKTLTDSRFWQCELGEAQLAVMPCGGTHIRSLAELHRIEVCLVQTDEQHIEMHTDVTPISF